MKKTYIIIALIYTAAILVTGCDTKGSSSGQSFLEQYLNNGGTTGGGGSDGGGSDDGGSTGGGTTGGGTTGGGTTGGGTTGGGTTPVPTDEVVKLVFMGDVMMSRKVETMVQNSGAGDYSFLFNKIASYTKGADVTFGNLESVISDRGTPDPTKSSQGIAFRAKPAAINGLLAGGVDIVSMANNHTLDYGRTAMSDCFTRLKAAGIAYVGAGESFDEAYSAKIITVKNTRIAFLAYTLVGDEPGSRAQKYDAATGQAAQSGVAWYYSKYIFSGIQAAHSLADIVVVSIHFGSEYDTAPSHLQDTFAHLTMDRKADIVIGHHPHVPQPIMVYQKGYLAYSLGNCVFDQSDAATKKGLIFEVTVTNKKISSAQAKNILINQYYQPELVN
jgi:poly-gamma-glutamate capsule biosynthesis protein CapA/YwtB (metallophosphatase superfamily)